MAHYRGRFAPSPTGRLHLGSMACALASWLDARAHNGTWLVRIEDIDPPRDIPGADRDILHTLAAFHLVSDEPVLWQHDRLEAYDSALRQLIAENKVYGCACTRSKIALYNRQTGASPFRYPGFCREGTHGLSPRSWRLRTAPDPVTFTDRVLGEMTENVEATVGDFVLKRADGLFAYQLAVVIDDAFQEITDVVRGQDLLDNTARQHWLQMQLGLQPLNYFHIPLVCDASGLKLSKQTKAQPVQTDNVLAVLETLWGHFGFSPVHADTVDAFLAIATECWKLRFPDRTSQSRQMSNNGTG